MRLGANIFGETGDPQSWAQAVKAKGYRAAYCPVKPDADDETVRAYADAAAEADIVIAEVGAWSNTISSDETERKRNIDKCIRCLDLSDRIGARCCVNITGTRAEAWHGPHPENLTAETFDLIVQVVREIVDAVQPTRSVYSLEAMPSVWPDGPEEYLELIEAIDRDGFAVHLDPVNIVNTPRRYYDNARFVTRCVRLLGPHIRSVHVKDVTMSGDLLVHIDECRPGTGTLDHATLLHELAFLGDEDLPIMLEHLPDEEQYDLAAAHLRQAASKEGLAL